MKAEFEILHPTTPEQFLSSSSESEKALEIYWPYLFWEGKPAVGIDLAASGDWRPEAPRAGRSSMTHDEIRERAGRGEALASIAREAGVSRQRVHAIVRG